MGRGLWGHTALEDRPSSLYFLSQSGNFLLYSLNFWCYTLNCIAMQQALDLVAGVKTLVFQGTPACYSARWT
jgi:hypothetical protein